MIKNNTDKKIAIIGGGTIGLYLAFKLAESNKVEVFERKKEIGKKCCSGLFSKRILSSIPESKDLIENKIEMVKIHFPKKEIKVNLSQTLFVMSHFKLDKLIAQKAKRKGANINLNEAVLSLPENYDYIIGADGYDSVTRKEVGLSKLPIRLGIKGFIDKKDNSEYVEVWPTKHNGFLWKIPRGKRVEYGILEESKYAKEDFNKFLSKKNIKIKEKCSGLVPEGLSFPDDSKVTLCGDAAGLTKPWSGGGVIWGLTAANHLVSAFPDFDKYQKVVLNKFKPKIKLSKLGLKIFYFLGYNLPWFLPKKMDIDTDFIFQK
ncbi:MAG: hypothetical protein ACOC1P_01285 [Minisyncoccales bacterium]